MLVFSLLASVTPRSAAGEVAYAPSSTPTASPTTSPSPTPTPTLTARELLTEANQSMGAKNTYHIAITMTSKFTVNTRTRLDGNVTAAADVSILPFRTHELTTARARLTRKGKTTTSKRTIDTVFVGARGAARPNHAAWTCIASGTSAAKVASRPSDLDILRASISGITTINNIPVWDVQAAVKASSLGLYGAATPKTVTAHLYISQSDFTLVRTHASYKRSVPGLTAASSITFQFSRYGEHVSVSLPAACRK